MTSQGSAHARFRRALLTKNLTIIDAAAAELGRLDLTDALRVLVVMAEKRDRRFDRAAARFAARVTLEPLTPHEAWHTAASYMAAAGLTPKEAQTALGHADIRTTLNIYAKAVPGWQQQAAAKLDAFLAAGGAVSV